MLFAGRLDDVSSMLWGVLGRTVSEANNSVSTQSFPIPIYNLAVRPDTIHSRYVRFLDSISCF